METYRPLAGIRVLSFELAFSLPAGTRALHDLGAEVVRVSPPERQQNRYISVIDGVFHGKPCIALDLTKAAAREVAFDLALEADVVCNNFRPRVLRKYGLGAERLRTAKPELITLQLSGYGTPGPWSDYPAFGPSTEAAGGLNRLLVDHGEIPVRLGTGVFSDQLSGRHAALAVVAALQGRQNHGEGASIDVSMTACVTHLLGAIMTRAQLRADPRAEPEYAGNRDARYAPQGIYPASGDDEWVSIAVTDDAAWRALVGVIGDPTLAPDLDRQARRARHDAIDAAIARWTAPRDKNNIASQLQGVGVAATPVRTVADAGTDPQFAARGALQSVRHRKAKLGYLDHPHPPLPWRIVGRERRRVTDYRHTGQDNDRILRRWLGLDDAAIAQLKAAGALASEPPLRLTKGPDAPLRDADHASRLGLTPEQARVRVSHGLKGKGVRGGREDT